MDWQQVKQRQAQLQQVVVTAEQMRAIENRMFAAGMPVAALMEKVGGLLARRIQKLYPLSQVSTVGVLVGPGHNGGDALVVARELHTQGYQVQIYRPLSQAKELTAQHAQFVAALGIPAVEQVEALQQCNLLIDGLFGFGLERPLEGQMAELIHTLNQTGMSPVLSLDLPSGLHTDTGLPLGTAIRATQTLCLGLWKLGLLQDQALAYIGTAELLDFDLPLADVMAVLGTSPAIGRVTPATAIAALPLPRPLATHKYKLGHLLLIGGSQRYAGGIILTGLGARASGVGMLSIAVPESLKPLLVSHLPEALILDCPETEAGAIAQLPENLDLGQFDAIVCGPGMTTEVETVIRTVLAAKCPLILDADGLNLLAAMGTVPTLQARQGVTILTPHLGEFRRLFPDQAEQHLSHPAHLAQTAAQTTGAIIVLKGARTAIANPQGRVWINPDSTPALARGGSGDVLAGLMGGLVAQQVLNQQPLDTVAVSAVWWHAQAGLYAAQRTTVLGVDAFSLTQFLVPALNEVLVYQVVP